jgi:hypothetical protein
MAYPESNGGPADGRKGHSLHAGADHPPIGLGAGRWRAVRTESVFEGKHTNKAICAPKAVYCFS